MFSSNTQRVVEIDREINELHSELSLLYRERETLVQSPTTSTAKAFTHSLRNRLHRKKQPDAQSFWLDQDRVDVITRFKAR